MDSTTNGSIIIDIANPALDNQPLIYDGVSAALKVSLTNQLGTAISLQAGTSASYLEIFMPLEIFSDEELQNMQVENISQEGWASSYNEQDLSLMLRWDDTEAGSWAAGSSFSFDISEILSTAITGTYSILIAFHNFTTAGVPLQLACPLILNQKPQSTNVDLSTVLDVDVTNDGLVYVSDADSPITNVLNVNFKNISTHDLYDGSSMWSGTPKVIVSFVYGITSGALAPNNKSDNPPEGSAWNISAKIGIDQTTGWKVTNPSVTGQANTPSWILEPIKTNQEIIGTGDSANVSFDFEGIISLTPPGATQVYLQFTGFTQNDNTTYNDALIVIPIHKQYPPNPGAIAIWSPEDEVEVSSPEQQLEVPLNWSMFGVASVKLTFNFSGLDIPDYSTNYEVAHQALNIDSYILLFSGVQASGMLTIYCAAYSDIDQQNLLNKVQCTVPINFPPVIYSFTIESIDTTAPNSNTFKLEWAIAGQGSFEIIAQDAAGGNPVKLSIPSQATSYEVYPIAAETIYTLNLYPPSVLDEEATTPLANNKVNMEKDQKGAIEPAATAQTTAVNQMPVGTIITYSGTEPPNGWLLCAGQSITQSQYPNLHALIGGTVPDLRDRFVVGAGKTYNLNEKGGVKKVTLTVDEMPSHKHYGFGESYSNWPLGIYESNQMGSHGGKDNDNHFYGTTEAGGDQAHENRPPYFALTYIIKY
ncbi:MAG: tail fiber protein [Saprospiraceae bacterium]|nr:tail fiber protein [Lewinella sp.]